MVNIDRYWTQAISELNDHVKKLRLDGVSIIRRKDEDGTDFVYINRSIYAGQEPIAPYKGYGVTGIVPGAAITPHDIERLQEQIKMFLNGAAFILGLHHFHSDVGLDNFDKYRRLATGFDTIFKYAEINNREDVNNFLWKHTNFVQPIEQAILQVQSNLKRKITAKVGVVQIHSKTPPYKEFINLHIFLKSADELKVFEDFVENWWKVSTSEADREELQLSYGKEWENDLIHFI